MQVTLCYSPEPRVVHECLLDLPLPTTVQEALAASGWLERFPELCVGSGVDVLLGIWGKKAQRESHLRPDDRLEVYRALRVDPKVARRERFNRQGSRGAGLFSKRRPGAKPGY
jgi:putative ubiquitin-RnfH superfamily antitoxin RatB of RatAB toxin-antitoxin module